MLSSGETLEILPIMPPQWVIFEREEDIGFEKEAVAATDTSPPKLEVDDQNPVYEKVEPKPWDADFKFVLYRVGEESIEQLGIECMGHDELRKIYLDRGKATTETLLAFQGGNVRQIVTSYGSTHHSDVKKWDPCDESLRCGKRVLVVYANPFSETWRKLPIEQSMIHMAGDFRKAVEELVDKSATGHPHARYFMEDQEVTMGDQFWREAMVFPRESVPSIVIMNGCEWQSVPMPLTVDEAIEVVRKYLR